MDMDIDDANIPNEDLDDRFDDPEVENRSGSRKRPASDQNSAPASEGGFKRRKLDTDDLVEEEVSNDMECEATDIKFSEMLLAELWQHLLTFLPMRAIGQLSLVSTAWSKLAWKYLTVLDLSSIIKLWDLTLIVNLACAKSGASIREIRLPNLEFTNQPMQLHHNPQHIPPAHQNSQLNEWVSVLFNKLSSLPSVRVIETPGDYPDHILELLFLGPPRRLSPMQEVAEALQLPELVPENPNAMEIDENQPGTPPRIIRPELVQVRVKKPAPSKGRFPLLEKIVFKKLATSEAVFGRICRAFPYLCDVDFLHCRGKRVTEQHLQHLLDVPKLPKNIVFFWAVGFNHSAYSLHLLDKYSKEIDVNFHHRSGQTPLTRACKKRYWSAVLDLIRSRRGVDVNIKARDGIAALHYAARDNNVEVLQELIRAGARVDEPKSDGCRSLHIAATYGWVEIVHALLDAQADVNAASKAGSTALHYASLYGQPNALKVLLKAKPDVDALYTGGWTALHLAVRRNYLEMARDLLDASANPNVAEIHGWTPLHSAVYKGYSNMVELLLKYSPDIEAVDKKHGRTPLHFVSMSINAGAQQAVGSTSGQPVDPAKARDIMQMLLKAGANCNAVQAKGRTALHLAAGCGFAEGVGLLIERGVDIWIKDRLNSTALHYAVEKQCPDAVTRLLDRELSFPAPTQAESEQEKRAPHGSDQRTPLFIATQNGSVQLARALFSHPNHHAELTHLCYGLSPLEAALLLQDRAMVDLLVEALGPSAAGVDIAQYAPGMKAREDLFRRMLDRERYMQMDNLPLICDGRKRAQSFWRCLTCLEPGSTAFDPAFCSSCAVKCHTGHSVEWRGVVVANCSCPCAADAEIRARKDGKTKRKGNEAPAAPHMPQYRSGQQLHSDPPKK